MFDLALQDLDSKMRARWESLKNSTKVWDNPSAATEFERGLLHPQLARELYTLLFEVLLTPAAKEMVLVITGLPRQLKGARVKACRTDDDLLKFVKELESARVKLLRQAIDDYKGSVGFNEGLKRMGRVSYEYRYRVALARFRALHPDSEVEDDPFTIRSEDDSLSMERRQPFDDSDPPES
ncbi:hypothetical protein B296_00046655 [Ensete ventricosum]|uniref:Uncharacterized protein n=1 Tax=Ensete ventricosum TaxID=4639 RepID=A0A426Z340_ENSVE|nr:hypothetical protein B296_00046655 [Ensete ventricosum]